MIADLGYRDGGSGPGSRWGSGSGLRIVEFECWDTGFVCRVSGFRSQVPDLKFRVSDFRCQVSSFGFRASDFRFRVEGVRFRRIRVSELKALKIEVEGIGCRM